MLSLFKPRSKAEAERLAQEQLTNKRTRQASKLEKLSNFDNSIAYRKARTQQHISTGQWNTRAGRVIKWTGEDRSNTLLCTGVPGTGKTVMAAYVIEALSAKYIQSREKLVYFFCEYDNERSTQATTVLKSIIRQLLDQEDDAFTANETSIDELLENPHDLCLLEGLLANAISSWYSVVIILDGIDECLLTELGLLLQALRNTMRRQATGMKLYLPGDDHISNLVNSLLDLESVAVTRMPEAELDLVELVQQLVNARRENGDLVVDDPNLYQKVIDVLCTRSQGIILWIKLQLDALCLQDTDKGIRYTLEHLPENLSETYNRLLTRILEEGHDETCNKIFQCTAAAKRPLAPNELRHAISWDPWQPFSMPERLIWNTGNIIRWCHGLITLNDLDDTLQFAHLSVKEFFCSPEPKHIKLQSFHFPQHEADRKLGEVCVACLSINDFGTQPVGSSKSQARLDYDSKMEIGDALKSKSPGDTLNKAGGFDREKFESPSIISEKLLAKEEQAVERDNPLIHYASEHWLSHTADFSPEDGLFWTRFQDLADGSWNFWGFNSTTSMFEVDDRKEAFRHLTFSHPHQALFRHWMTRRWNKQDLPLVLTLILHRKRFSWIELLPPLAQQSKSPWLEAMLSLESEALSNTLPNANTEWIKELTWTERTNLLLNTLMLDSMSTFATHSTIIQLGIDPYHECDNAGKITTLFEELIRNLNPVLFKDVCGIMLASKADFERKIAFPGRTALHIAAEYHRPAATAILLEHGALVDAKDNCGQTALHIVAKGPGWAPSVLETVRALLKVGAFYGIRDIYGNVAIQYARGEVAHEIHVITQGIVYR